MTGDDLDKLLDAVARHAESLRATGVRKVGVGEVWLELAPIDPPTPVYEPTQATPTRVDPMNDPATYGLPPGSKVPGLDWIAEMQEAQDKRSRELGMGQRPRKG